MKLQLVYLAVIGISYSGFSLDLDDSLTVTTRILTETESIEHERLIKRAEFAEQQLAIQGKNFKAIGLIGFTMIFGCLGYVFYNQQKLKSRQSLKETELQAAFIKIETQNKLQEQRLEISKDLHDNIGAQLAFIISSIDNLKYGFEIKDDRLNKKLNTISSFTSATIYELRDTIWAMNKNGISLEDLQVRISNFIDKAILVDDTIDFVFQVSEAVHLDMVFSSIEGMNIYRILQEAIQNAIQHASPTKITVTVERKNMSIQFVVTDNGRGFDMNTVHNSIGLRNIKKRARAIEGDIYLDSVVNKGTKVILTI